jgi:predicted transcriptional regulator
MDTIEKSITGENGMATTIDEIERFHRFALERVASHNASHNQNVELDELLIEWYDLQDRDTVNSVIRQGLADIDAGKGREAGEVMAELRQKYQLTDE